MSAVLLTTISTNAIVGVGSAALDIFFDHMNNTSSVGDPRGHDHRFTTCGSNTEGMTASGALPEPYYRFFR